MTCFEKMSGMRINYNKSDLTPINLEDDESHNYVKIFYCRVGSFPFKYLGIPLHFEKLRREDSQPVVDKIIKTVVGWKGKLLSYGARLTLLRAYLASIPIYLLSVIKFPKWAIKAINTQMEKNFWNDHENYHKYHLANWPSLSMRKEQGGYGYTRFEGLESVFTCFMGSAMQMVKCGGK
jgi:hypothetical protein